MHPALHPDRLRQVEPVAGRRLASAVCSADWTVTDICHLLRLIRATGPRKVPLFLPVFNALLEPNRIPSLQNIEVISSETQCILEAGMFALGCIGIRGTPPDAQIALWPRAFAWAHFFWTIRDHVPIVRDWEPRIYIDFLWLSSSVSREHGDISPSISTPGFYHILICAWRLLLQDAETWNDSMMTLFPLMTNDTTKREHVLEMIEAAGGTLEDLTNLILKLIRLLAPTRDAPLSMIHRNCLRMTVSSIKDIEHILRDGAHLDTSALLPLLVSGGGARILTIAICASSRLIDHDSATAAMLTEAWDILGIIIDDTGNHALSSALEHGLLLAIIRCAHPAFPAPVRRHLGFLLTDVLAPSTASFRLLGILRHTYEDVKELAAAQTFVQSATFRPWSTFATALSWRLTVMGVYTRLTVPSKAVCSNIDCGHIDFKTTFKRCAGCKSFLYCSAACQRSDWRDGAHRDICTGYETLRRDTCDENFTSRDRAFTRLLLNQDYLGARDRIQFDEMKTLRDQPGMGTATLFDYRVAPVQITTHTLAAAHAKLPFPPEIWADWVRRTLRSNGRVQLHIVVLRTNCGEGREGRCLIMPLRATTSFLRDTWLQFVTRPERPTESWGLADFSAEFHRLEVPADHVEFH
ncbi:hypothetical protein B0H16DRAFT_1507539 [Mycena metata]|uniref:MYND-type domain-containing protein n=1 Tax=Mycena metata TaxID=1033252 RepID=A0AAD7NUH1_9AGAR|nr:hypothetical protein B0H16DRAFT_1507539 [Mycena metata]